MSGLQVADLVVIGARVLEVDTATVLDRLDVTAAEAALAEARPLLEAGRPDPAGAAAVLLHALLRHRPLAEGNEQVAVLAMAQFLLLNGFEVVLDPPEQTELVLDQLADGRLDAAGLGDWLAPRISPRVDVLASCADQPSLLRWLPGRRRRQSRSQDRFHRFTDRARMVVTFAQTEARRLGHHYIGTEHLLLGLIGVDEGVAARALQARGIGLEAVRDGVEEIIGHGEGAPPGHIPFTPRAKRVLLECALREAMQLGHNYVGTEHLLLGLLREGRGVAAEVLTGLGAYHTTTREQVIELLHGYLRDQHGRHGTRPPAPLPDLRDIDDRIARARQDKETALDAGDAEHARTLRAAEQRLREQRRERVGAWMAGADVVALVEETHRLRAEIDRLRALIRRHGIDLDDGPDQSAQTGR